jgi:hypothetical protein
VAPLPSEGFVVSGYSVATWRPTQGWRSFEQFDGSRPGLSGARIGYANGVEVSPDRRHLFIADGRRHSVFRYPLSGGELTIIPINIQTEGAYRGPDNLRWGDDGLLYAADPIFPASWSPELMSRFHTCFQQALCVTGMAVVAINPHTAAVREILHDETGFDGRHGLVATALQVGDEIWLNGNRTQCLAVIKSNRRAG